MRPLLVTAGTVFDGLAVEWWSEPGRLDTTMQDAVHVSSNGSVLRVGAIDGCTPMRQTPNVAGVNGGSYASALAASALHELRPAPEVLEAVNAHLYRLGPELVAAARPSAAAAIAEITTTGGQLEVRAWAAGDAQVWVCDPRGWRLLVGGSSCAHETSLDWASRRDALKAAGLSFDELQQHEAAFYDDPALFVHHTPLGRFEHLLLQEASAPAFEVVCATDGALLNPAALGDIDAWITEVRNTEARGVARLKAADDLALVRVRPRT